MSERPKRCAITGAAQGIGRALASEFGRAGYEILGLDVDAAAIERATRGLEEEGVGAWFIQADLSRHAEVERALAELCATPPVDVLIHNAGISCVGLFEASDWASQRRVLEVNLLTPMVLTTGLLRERWLAPEASLVYVSSLSRFVGYPGAAGYAASKDGLAAYARSLRAALEPEGMHVMTVYPGPTRTDHARRYSPDNRRERKRMAPEKLAAQIRRAVEKRKHTLVPGLGNRALAALGHVLPRVTERSMKRAVLDRLEAGAPVLEEEEG